VFKTFSAALLALVITSTGIAQPVKTQSKSEKCDAIAACYTAVKKQPWQTPITFHGVSAVANSISAVLDLMSDVAQRVGRIGEA
jgi:hypothetical protein